MGSGARWVPRACAHTAQLVTWCLALLDSLDELECKMTDMYPIASWGRVIGSLHGLAWRLASSACLLCALVCMQVSTAGVPRSGRPSGGGAADRPSRLQL